MDGFADLALPEAAYDAVSGYGLGAGQLAAGQQQRTLKSAIFCVGIGLHTGQRVNLALYPAPPGHGIVFRRTDLQDADIPARFDLVVDTRLCTVLGLPDRPEVRVGTVEHLLAALLGSAIDNVLVEIDGPEVPILDGSAASFVFLLQCAGTVEQDAARAVIEIIRPVRVETEEGYAAFLPHDPPRRHHSLDLAVSIDFEAAAIGRQALSMQLTPTRFRDSLANARTFTLASEVAGLQAAGLARGGSLENAVVVDQERVLNPGGLRMPDEFVRHKMLDVVGDLALASAMLSGRFMAHRTGHRLNNQLLRALFADPAAWRWAPQSRKFRSEWMPAAA